MESCGEDDDGDGKLMFKLNKGDLFDTFLVEYMNANRTHWLMRLRHGLCWCIDSEFVVFYSDKLKVCVCVSANAFFVNNFFLSVKTCVSLSKGHC